MRSYRGLVRVIQAGTRAGVLLLLTVLAVDLPAILIVLLLIAWSAVVVHWLMLRFGTSPGSRASKRPTGVVVLPGNAWGGCHVDRIAADWPASVRGFCRIWSGRHRVVSAPAALDFVLYPGEVFIRKLSGDTWVPEHPENEFDLREKAANVRADGADENGLVDYTEMVTMLGRHVLDADVPGLLARFARLVARVQSDERFAPVLEDAQTQGTSLIGVPLGKDDLQLLTGRFRQMALRQETPNQRLRVLELGLAILPDDPWLLLVRARLLCEVGLPEEAVLAVNLALSRDQVLQREGRREGQILKAEILGHLGRAGEGLVLITHVLAEHPQDPAAQRVRRLLSNS